MTVRSDFANSAAGVSIHYEVRGAGPVALVFVHGWCCSLRYWDQQVDHFASRYTVVAIDLAGHGESGRGRADWTMPAFGQDVAAVVRQLGLRQVVLAGHSMGGPVIVAAAQLLAEVVIGVVGVDTWRTLDLTRSAEQSQEILAPMRVDYLSAASARVRGMFIPASAPALVERVVAGMTSTPAEIAIGAMGGIHQYDAGQRAELLAIAAPKYAINSDYLATDHAAAARHGVRVVEMSGTGHFVMLEAPDVFNRLLDDVAAQCVAGSAAR